MKRSLHNKGRIGGRQKWNLRSDKHLWRPKNLSRFWAGWGMWTTHELLWHGVLTYWVPDPFQIPQSDTDPGRQGNAAEMAECDGLASSCGCDCRRLQHEDCPRSSLTQLRCNLRLRCGLCALRIVMWQRSRARMAYPPEPDWRVFCYKAASHRSTAVAPSLTLSGSSCLGPALVSAVSGYFALIRPRPYRFIWEVNVCGTHTARSSAALTALPAWISLGCIVRSAIDRYPWRLWSGGCC